MVQALMRSAAASRSASEISTVIIRRSPRSPRSPTWPAKRRVADTWRLLRASVYVRLQPLSHTVTASVTHGYSLCHIRLQPLSQTRLRPLSHTATASVTYGYSLCHKRPQPLSHTATASITNAVTASAQSIYLHGQRLGGSASEESPQSRPFHCLWRRLARAPEAAAGVPSG